MFIYFWEKERDRVWAEEEQREGDTESKVGSRLQAVCTAPDAGLKLTSCAIMTWAEVGHSTDWATQVPLNFFNVYSFLRDRERQSASGGGAKREGDPESEAGSTSEPNVRFKLTNHEIMTWAEVGCLHDWATQVPQYLVFDALVNGIVFFISFSHSFLLGCRNTTDFVYDDFTSYNFTGFIYTF